MVYRVNHRVKGATEDERMQMLIHAVNGESEIWYLPYVKETVDVLKVYFKTYAENLAETDEN